MLSKKSLLVFVSVLMIVFSFGCATKNRVTDFTIISTKNIELNRLGEMNKGSERATGRDKLTVIFGIPMGSFPTIKEAIDSGIESIPGAIALVDGVIYNEVVNYIVAREFSYIVEGTPLVDPKIAMALPTKYIYANYNEKEKKFSLTYLSKEKFKSVRTDVLSNFKATGESILDNHI